MRRLSLPLALALALLGGMAEAESQHLLRKIEAVTYFVEAPVDRAKACSADLGGLMTTIKFYGEQSRLRWYDLAEERTRLKKSARGWKEPPPPPFAAGDAEWDAWLKEREDLQRDYDRSVGIPLFRMAIYPVEAKDGCVAFVHVGVSASLRGAHIAHTGTPFAGSAELWDKFYYVKGEAAGFPAQLEDVAKRAVKEFVNDWSDANR